MKPIATLADGREVFSYPASDCDVSDVHCVFKNWSARYDEPTCTRPRDVDSCMHPQNMIFVTKEQYLLLNLVHGPES